MYLTELDRYGRRITVVLFAAQSLSSSGTIMLFTISSILAVELGGNMGWTGVPMTIQLAGAATAAWPLGKFMDRYGRRAGLNLGQISGILGTLAAGVGVFQSSLRGFLLGTFLLGFARGALDMGRYAAADANPPSRRARAISSVVFGGTIGSLAGPQLLSTVERLGADYRMPSMSMPWFVVAMLYGISFLLVFAFLRPDPSAIARAIAEREKPSANCPNPVIRAKREILHDVRAYLAISSIVSGHLVMYLMMTVTPVFMSQGHQPISSISWVIFAHVLGMYGFSFFVGWLSDWIGRISTILLGSAILILACILAPIGTAPSWLALILFLVGLGWNFCFVTGSTYLSDILRPGERGSVQGMVDTLVNVAAGLSCLASGLLFASVGFSVMSWISLGVAALPCIFVVVTRFRTRVDVLTTSG